MDCQQGKGARKQQVQESQINASLTRHVLNTGFSIPMRYISLLNTRTSVSIGVLKKNAKYYNIRIRVFTEDENNRYVFLWSSVKKIKARKKYSGKRMRCSKESFSFACGYYQDDI